MNVLVDTCVWSLAVRRAKRIDSSVPGELAELIREGRVLMLGAVRQELLSGIKERPQFEQLRDHLRAFRDTELASADYELAAESFNRCRTLGIQGSNTDFLICAAAKRRAASVFTTDADFGRFSKVLGVVLHQPR